MEKHPKKTPLRILAAETSGPLFSAAAVLDPRDGSPLHLAAEVRFEAGHKHSELLRPACEDLLREAGWELKDLGLLAAVTGPGSFTGLRVGLSFFRTLAQALEVPLVGVTSFAAVAETLRAWPGGNDFARLCVLVDSIGREVFCGAFRTGELEPEAPYRVAVLDEVLEGLRGPRGRILFAGEGSLRHSEEIRKKLGSRAVLAPPEWARPTAFAVARCASEAFRGKPPKPGDWAKVVPFYLRAPVAVERLDYRREK